MQVQAIYDEFFVRHTSTVDLFASFFFSLSSSSSSSPPAQSNSSSLRVVVTRPGPDRRYVCENFVGTETFFFFRFLAYLPGLPGESRQAGLQQVLLGFLRRPSNYESISPLQSFVKLAAVVVPAAPLSVRLLGILSPVPFFLHLKRMLHSKIDVRRLCRIKNK